MNETPHSSGQLHVFENATCDVRVSTSNILRLVWLHPAYKTILNTN